MDLAPDELLTSIRLPRRFADWHHFYRKVGTRRAQAISKVCFAGRAAKETKFEIASRQRSADADVDWAETWLTTSPVLGQISPIDDIRSTARYRSQVAEICSINSWNVT